MSKTVLLKHIKFYLLRQQNPSPILFFLLFASRKIYSGQQFHIQFHLLALFLTCFFKYNLLYLLASFIFVENDFLSAFFFLSSAASCNRKWKVYLFLFMIADSYFSLVNDNPQYIGVVSVAICVATYKNLIFETNRDNLQYFMGFFMYAAWNAAALLADSLQIWLQPTSLLFIITVAGYLSKIILESRLKEIQSLELESIRNPIIMARYIDFMLQDFKVEPLVGAKLDLHARKCQLVTCYCKSDKFNRDSEFYLRQMFENFMNKVGSLGDQHLWEYYISFYIKKEQAFIAYHYLLKWRPSSYFSMISKLKCEAIIIDFLQKKNSLNPFEKEYVYGLQYDEKCQYVSTEIYQILKLKIYFWKEVAKQSLSLHKLQSLGGEIVSRMYELNKFYNLTVKEYEKYLFCFDSTILYSMYLISTTNFKDYAKGIIKHTSKIMEEVCVSERGATETFAIRAVIKNSKESYIKKATQNFKAEKDISSQMKLEQSHQNDFKLVIDAVSSGFCRMINIPKQEIIGSELNSLIPNCYKDIHNVRLSQILDFNTNTIKELTPSKVLHAELKLLFKGANDELFSGLICIKYQMDIKEGVTFLSVIKKTPQKKCEALATLQGELMQKEKGFPAEIMKHSYIKKCLLEMEQEWKLYRTIKCEKFNLMVNRANYEITISSPFSFLILDKECLHDKAPPIHVQLCNEENSKIKSITSSRINNNADYEIKKMEMMINCEQESSASSTKGVNSAITIISNFSENNTVPIYKYIIVTFLALLLCNISLNLSFSLMPVLPWDNTSPANNPIVDNMNLYLLEIMQSKAVLNLQDLLNYQKYKSILNTSRISSFFSGKKYSTQAAIMFADITKQLSLGLNALCTNYSSLLWPSIKQRFDQNITIPNILKGVTYTNPSTEVITYLQAMVSFAVDTYLVYKRMNYDSLLIRSLYNIVQGQTTSLTVIPGIIDSSFNDAYKKQVILGLVMMVIMLALVIPMCLVLRKRFKTHERMFDLLSSVESEDVAREIQSLLYISNILNNYNESKDKLRLNLLDYQANSINPRRRSKTKERKPSVMNEMLMGLEMYDVGSDSSDSNNRLQSEKTLIVKLKQRENFDELDEIFYCIKNEMFQQLSKEAQQQGRKRSGELDLSGSQYDDKKRVNGKNCMLYILLLSFLPFMIITLLINFNSISYSQLIEYNINDAYGGILRLNKRIYQAKVYLWEGSNSLQTTFNATTALGLLQPLLSKAIHYDTIIDNVSASVPPNFYGTAKLSQYSSSLRIIEGEMTSTMKNLVEFRYILQGGKGNQTISDSLIAQKLYEQIFYLQSLSNKREVIVRGMAGEIQQSMFDTGSSATYQKEMTLIALVIWSVVSFGIGLALTLGMKQQFFKEVYILTFLNEEMLLKNKRVESYLDNLSKNTYF